MNKEHDKLFADLDALTEEQIEVALLLAFGTNRFAPWSSTTFAI